MNDKELADRVVALGVGRHLGLASGEGDLRIFGINKTPIGNTGMFVRDWRVAGALMEKCHQFEVRIFGFKIKVGDSWVDNPEHPADLPRAICEACVAALENKDESL